MGQDIRKGYWSANLTAIRCQTRNRFIRWEKQAVTTDQMSVIVKWNLKLGLIVQHDVENFFLITFDFNALKHK